MSLLNYYHPVFPAHKLKKKPVQVILNQHRYVLFRDSKGFAAVLDDICPHRRASLSKGFVNEEGRITCPYHGWHFDGQGKGQSPGCPDLKGCHTQSYQLIERYGYLWLSSLTTSIKDFPNISWSDYDFAGSFDMSLNAPIDVALDNICEDEHFAFIHSTFGWNKRDVSKVKVDTQLFHDHSFVRYDGPQRATLWGVLGGVSAGDDFYNEWSTYFNPVRSEYTFGWHDQHTGKAKPITTKAVVFLVPESDKKTRIIMLLFMNIAPSIYRYMRPLMFALSRHISRKELKHDVRLIEDVAQAPSDIQGMQLTRFDKVLVHNRKLLNQRYWQKTAKSRHAYKTAVGS